MISYSDARKKIEAEVAEIQPGTEHVPLGNSLERVLANDVFAAADLPAFDNSAMDGVAIQFEELRTQWTLVGEIAAGHYSEVDVRKSYAVQIMTGAKIPISCDTIVPNEDFSLIECDKSGGTKVILNTNSIIKKGQFVRRAGEDLKNGSMVLKKSTVISPSQIPVLAACGQSQVLVYKKLRVAIFVTGDELVEIDQVPVNDQIRCSNLPSIITLVRAAGHEPISYGIVKDDRHIIQQTLKKIIESDVDVLLTTGGASVGKFDFINQEIEKLGVKSHFSGSAIKPGMPCTFGTVSFASRKMLIFALPGNPVSCFVNFRVYVAPAMQKIFGVNYPFRPRAMLCSSLKKSDSKRHFIRGLLQQEKSGGEFSVTPFNLQASGNLWGMGQANCLIVVEEQTTELHKGDFVECMLI